MKSPIPSRLPFLRAACRLSIAIAAFAFVRSASAQVSALEISPSTLVSSQQLGQSVGANGSFIAVGSALDATKGNDAGSVWVFNMATGALVRKIYAPDAAADDLFGTSVAVSGNTLVVGAPGKDSGKGAFYIFKLSTGKQVVALTAGAAGDSLGQSVALEGDILVVGAPEHTVAANAGAGVVYTYNVRTGALPLTEISSPSPEADANFGAAVAIYGNMIAVGAPKEDAGGTDRGAAYTIDAGSSALLDTYTAGADGADGDEFGAALAFTRGRLIIGAPDKNSATGKVYTFDAITGSEIWSKAGNTVGEEFGSSLAGGGDLFIVGAEDFDLTASVFDCGIVHVLQAVDGTLVQSLTEPNPSVFDCFGKAVTLVGDRLIVTADTRSSRIFWGGAAFRFQSIRTSFQDTELATKGNTPPGALDTTFSVFKQLAVAPTGFSSFLGTLAGAGASAGRNTGIWTNGWSDSNLVRPETLVNVFITGSANLPGSRKGVTFTNPVSNVDALLGFTAKTSGLGITGANDMVFVTWDSRGASKVIALALKEGDTVGSGPISSFQPPRQTHTAPTPAFGEFAAPYTNAGAGVSSSRSSGITCFKKDGTTVVTRSFGSAATGITGGLLHGQFLPRVAYESDHYTYTTLLTGTGVGKTNNLAVFTDGTAVTNGATVVRTGETAPDQSGSAMGTFTNFLGEANNSAHTFIHATIKPDIAHTAANSDGIWSDRTAGLNLSLLKGTSHTGLPAGVTIKRFIRFAADSADNIFAWVQLQGAGVTSANDGALIVSLDGIFETSNSVEVLLREGYAAPGCRGARVGAITALDTESNGGYAILASLVAEAGGAASTDNLALFTGNVQAGTGTPNHMPVLVLRKGQRFARAGLGTGSGAEIVKSISFPGYTTDATGAMNTGLSRLVTSIDPDGGGSLGNVVPVCDVIVVFNDRSTTVVSVEQ